MNDQEKDRLIVLALGECWHEWEKDGPNTDPEIASIKICIKCSKDNRYHRIPPLATPEGFFWWWERVQKQKWYDVFIQWAKKHLRNQHGPPVLWWEKFFHEVRGRDVLAEWLDSNRDKWEGEDDPGLPEPDDIGCK